MDDAGPVSEAAPKETAPQETAPQETARWIVGIDGSDDAMVALHWALADARAWCDNGRPVALRLVWAWHVPVTASTGVVPMGVAGTMTTVDWTDVERAVEDRLDELVASVDFSGIEVEALVERGAAARVLLDHADAAARLVVGRRGRSGLKELVFGSVSRQCATHATVPTVIVPRTAPIGSVQRVVVGFDGSDHAVAALRWALDDAHLPTGAEIEVVEAFEISPFEDPEVTAARFPDEVEAAEREFRDVLDAFDPDHRAIRRFSLRSARRALSLAATDADLVVVGARGRGAVGAALLGSVSDWMVHHTTCAIVIVPA